MTVIVLALDALDAGLVDYFDISSFHLKSSRQIETFAHSQKTPYTPEVWATVATGLGPEKHGVSKSGTSEWRNPLLELGSQFTSRLPERKRGKLGRFVRRITGERERIGHTDVETIFDKDNTVVRNWPGVLDGRDLQRAWDLMYAVSNELSRQEFERELLALSAEQFAWAREMLNHDVSLAGVHIHTLDAAGHAYASDEKSYEHMYRRIGDFVDELRTSLGENDELLLLSDHGINVSFYEPNPDQGPGGHSWRAYASATTKEVPSSVFEVVDWVNEHVEMTRKTEKEENDIDIPTEQLRELGYIE